jgi:5-epi-alpha-selinene synthase
MSMPSIEVEARASVPTGTEAPLFCPFPSQVSPWAGDAQAESLRWARRFELCADEDGYRRLARARIAWLTARAFPMATRTGLQIAADWTTLFCLLDDLIEAKGANMLSLARLVSRALDAFQLGSAAADDAVGRALVHLRERMREAAGDAWVRRFSEILERLFSAFMWEGINRHNAIRPSVSAYLTMREITVGVLPQLALAELTDAIKLSPAVLSHPTVRRLSSMSCNVVGWMNDIFTFERELAEGEIHNLVIVLMDQQGLPIEEARRVVRRRCEDEVRAFISLEQQLPDVGEESAMLRRYVGIMRSWMRGHLDWALETGRYKPPCARA